MTREPRPTGAMVRPLDTDALNRALDATYPGQTLRAVPGQVLALKHGTTDQYAVVCDEGVGWDVIDGQARLLVNVGLMLDDRPRLPLDVVLAAAAKSKEVDLSDTVRRFGDRLEVNFGIWFQYITGRSTWEARA